MIEQLAGRVAVITGAGGGLGREFARLAAESGSALTLEQKLGKLLGAQGQ